MNFRPTLLAAIAALIALALAAGYWLGTRRANVPAEPASPPPASTPGARQILYYRNPMGQPDTSPVPKKDSMGMDYIPVYADEADDSGVVQVSPGRRQLLGVRTEPVRRETLDRRIQAAGRIEADERRVHEVSARFPGYIERLDVNTTGQGVRRGQVLFSAYSPEVATARREYAIALRGVERLQGADAATREGMQALVESSRARLRNWHVSEAADASGRSLVLRAPADGIVTEKNALPGMRFAAGEVLYRITNLDQVWLIAEVQERDLGLLAEGATASVTLDAWPARHFQGRVGYIYPNLDPATRTVPARIELDNVEGLLKPGLYARVEIDAIDATPRLTVASAALMDGGTRRIVLVDMGDGRFEPRPVQVGQGDGERVEILDGLHEGENVVVSANFLIDADSRLKTALHAFAPASTPDVTSAPAAAAIVHQAEGRIESFDAARHELMLSHGPIARLGWPAMTMPFGLANAALAAGLQPGQAITFDFVERAPGEWIITRIEPRADTAADAAPAPATLDHGAHPQMDHADMDHGQADDHAGHH